MKKLVWILVIVVNAVMGQAPVINGISTSSTYPGDNVIITGSGFSSTPSQLQVWFGHARGNILASSDYSIEVEVPPSARTENITVINLSSHLSTKSSAEFSPYFNGTGFSTSTLSAPITFSATTEIFDLCTCDLDGDGKPDIAATKFNQTNDLLAPDLIVLKNQSTIGSLSFAQFDKTNMSSLNLGAPTEKITCGDLNGDGKPDLVASRTGSTKNQIYVLPNTSTPGTISFGTFIPLVLDVGHFARDVSIDDLNGDGKPEIIVTNSFNNVLYIYNNQSSGGTLSINPTPIKISVTGASTTYGLDVKDLNGDRKPELIVNQFQSSNIFILKNTSSATISFDAPIPVTVSNSLNDLIAADLNEDGLFDLVATSTFANQISVMMNTSSGSTISFGPASNLPTGNGPWGIDVGDIDGDEDLDIIVPVRNSSQVNIFLSNGNNSAIAFSKVDMTTTNPTRNVKIGDLDGDAKPDLAYTSFNSGSSVFTLEIVRNKTCFQPSLINETPLTICAGQTIRLESIPGFGVTAYDWKDGGAPVASGTDPFLDIVAAGNYTVTATSEGGACALTTPVLGVTAGAGSVPVLSNAPPDIDSNSPLCSGGSLNLTTAVTGVTYAWNGPNGFTSTQQNPTIASITSQDAGEYALKVMSGGCTSNEVTVTVDVASLDDFTITSSVASGIICQGGNLSLSVNTASGYQYQWIKDGADIAGQTSATLSVTQAGAYKVRVQNIALSCSIETAPFTVEVLTAPVAAFSALSSACTEQSVSFTNTSSVDSQATPVYSWDFGDGSTSTSSDPAHTYTTAQSATASLTVTYSGIPGCSDTATKDIDIVAATLPNIAASSSSACPGDIVDLSIAGTFAAILWSTNETSSDISVNQPGVYTVSTIDANSCPGADTVTIASNPLPSLAVSAEKNIVAAGESTQLTATGADSYAWSPAATLSDTTIANPVATPTETTVYTVEGSLTAGCSASATITIEVNGEAILLDIPNVFSPNGDATNDLWVIPDVGMYTDCTLSVFDRAGRKIFEQRGYQNQWDGTYEGRELPQGTYYYIFGCPDKKPLTGNVLIAR